MFHTIEFIALAEIMFVRLIFLYAQSWHLLVISAILIARAGDGLPKESFICLYGLVCRPVLTLFVCNDFLPISKPVEIFVILDSLGSDFLFSITANNRWETKVCCIVMPLYSCYYKKFFIIRRRAIETLFWPLYMWLVLEQMSSLVLIAELIPLLCHFRYYARCLTLFHQCPNFDWQLLSKKYSYKSSLIYSLSIIYRIKALKKKNNINPGINFKPKYKTPAHNLNSPVTNIVGCGTNSHKEHSLRRRGGYCEIRPLRIISHSRGSSKPWFISTRI